MLSADAAEEAMPCFSADGTHLYYTSYSSGIGSIVCMDLSTGQIESIFCEPGVNAYYPAVSGKNVYFTK